MSGQAALLRHFSLMVCLILRSCSTDAPSTPSSSGFQPSQSTQDGLQVFSAYFEYFAEYKQAQGSTTCNPTDPSCYVNSNPCGSSVGPPNANTVACQILNPPRSTTPPNPIDPISLSIAPLVFPPPGSAVLPTSLSNLLQNEFQAILGRVPTSHTSQVKGWSLKMGSCSGANQVLWSGAQTNSGSGGGSICISPLIIRAVFVDLAASPAANLFKDLVKYYSSDPLAFNGDSRALIRNYASKEHLNMTADALNAVAGVVDGEVVGLGTSVLPTFKSSIDYLMAREVAQIYLASSDENTISAAASALLRENVGAHIDLSPLSTLLLPGAIGTIGATNWGVSRVGDGQQVLTGIINGIGGDTP
jgi:hypothetical protein